MLWAEIDHEKEHAMKWTESIVATVLAVALPAAPAAPAARAAGGGSILDAAGVEGGLVVHLGCGDGKLTAALGVNDRYLVQGLDKDAGDVTKAREHIGRLGLYGPVSVSRWNGRALPYVDNLVNLVVAEETDVPPGEIMRVLVPRGVAYVKKGGSWRKTVKPWPKEIDEWTHYLHGPDNNAVAADSRIDIPRSLQWVSGPRWGRSHEELASMSAAVSAGGRVFYIVDEAPLASIRFLGRWKLVARDAFNGTLLWKRPIAQWNDHLRHFRSGPTHLPRRLVAAGGTVYVTAGLAGPVIALDGATGRERKIYKGTERTEEILADNGVLYLVVGTSEANRRGGGLHKRGEPEPTHFRYIAAVNAETGEQIWKRDSAKNEFILPLTLAVKGQRLYYQSTFGVVCLDARDGKEQWKTPRATPQRRMGFSAPTLVATDEVVLCADRDTSDSVQDKASAGKLEWGVHGWNEGGFSRRGKSTLRAYAAGTGKELWSAPCTEGYNSPVDLFVVDDTVWVGTGFNGHDLKTGKVKGKIDASAPRVGMPHHRCYRNKASERFIFTGKSGIEVLSLDKKKWLSNNSWIRGTCQYGIIPANGFLYAPPDACACYLTVKAPGFIAAAPQRDPTGHLPFPDKPVLEKGPAYGQSRQPTARVPAGQIRGVPSLDWPMYRHDAARSGAASAIVPAALKQKWSAPVGGKLTQPVVAGAVVFVASSDTHTVHALAAADGGREIWRFTAGGRIDSAPTVYNGTVLFGSADGWVYCLGAANGRLAWRFRAAPAERLISAYGQIESIWPVHGSVLVQNDTLYVTAGRSSYMDGGIVLYRIEPATGKQLSRTVLYHLDPETGRQIPTESGFNMDGTTSDILTGDGESVYLKYFAFDRAGQRTQEANNHLFAIAGLLGEEWFVRSYWIVGKGKPGAGWGGWARAAGAFPAGRILCFNKGVVYGYGRQKVAGGPTGHKADAYHLFAASRSAAPPKPLPKPLPKPKPGQKRRRRRPRGPKKGPPIWSNAESLIVRAMVLGDGKLVVAGPVDLGKKTSRILAFENEAEALAGFAGSKGIFLRVVSAADGKTVSQTKLDAMPVFDGMSAAGGKVYLSLRNGSLVCFGK